MPFSTKPVWPLQQAVDKAVQYVANKPILAEANDGETVKFTYECEGFWPRIVTATKIGDLALEWTKDDWEIYHLPTLSKFNIMHGDYTKEQLISWCEKVQGTLETDWDILLGLTPERFKNKDCTWTEQQAKDRIQRLCLNTKVE